MTRRTIYRQMICPIGFTLKERAPMLYKFFRTRFGRKLGLKIAILFFKSGYILLQIHYLFLQNLRLVLHERKPLLNNGGATMLVNERLKTGD